MLAERDETAESLQPDDESLGAGIEPTLIAWRKRALYAALVVLAVAGLPAYATPILNALQGGQMSPLLWVYLAVYISLLVFGLLPSLDLRVRGWGMLLLGYTGAVASLARLGLAGSGRLYLFAIPVFAIMVVGRRAGYLTAVLSMALYGVFAALPQWGWVDPSFTIPVGLTAQRMWIEAGLALAVFLLLITVLLERFHGLQLRTLHARRLATGELRERLAFEKLIARISTDFVNLGPDEVDAGIQHGLELVGKYTGLDHCFVFLLSGDGTSMTRTHEWNAPGIDSFLDRPRELALAQMPWLAERLGGLQPLLISRIAALPPEVGSLRAELEALKVRSLVAVPMVYRGRSMGIIGLDSMHVEIAWTQDTVALLRLVGEIFVNALEHKRAQAIQAGQHQFLELLATGGEFKETLRSLVRIIEEQWPGMFGLVLLMDEDGRRLHVGAAVSLPQAYADAVEGMEIGPAAGSCGTACYRRKRVIVEDIATDPLWEGMRATGLEHGLRACWSEPVLSPAGRPVGTFAMYYRQPRAPTPQELATIETAAHLVGVAVEHRRAQQEVRGAYEQLERRVRERTHELATLNAIAAVVSRSLDLKEILKDALAQTMQIMEADAGIAHRYEESNQMLIQMVSSGLSDDLVRRTAHLPLLEALAGKPLGEGRPLVLQVSTEFPEGGLRQSLETEGFQTAIGIPLMVRGKLVGSLVLGTRRARTLSPDEGALLMAIGQQVGVAVENAQLYDQAERSAAVAERSRLARELHDSVTQSLYSVTLYAEAAARLLQAGKGADASEHLRALRDTAQDALREMRLLIFELRPIALERGGLTAALQERLDAVEVRGGMQAELRVEGTEHLSPMVQEELYHIAQEALNNVLKHARALTVRVHVQFCETETCVEVTDDGVGMALDAARQGGGLGLRGMRERAQRIGARLDITSAPGEGTCVCLRVPTGPPGG